MILGIDLVFRHDWRSAEQEFHRALELTPESTDALRHYAFYYLLPMRRLDEAIALQKRAMDLDPLLPVLHWSLAATYTMARQWNLAMAHCQSALEIDPHSWLAHMFLGLIRGLIPIGKLEEWIQSCETGAQLANRTSYALGLLGWAYANFGLTEKAHTVLKELEDMARSTYVLPGAFARVLLGLGEIDRALDWMEIAAEDWDPSMINSHLYPFYDVLRSHPRYHALLRKMNLEP
jgi:tetratricopeptide (TPR) repeat protein